VRAYCHTHRLHSRAHARQTRLSFPFSLRLLFYGRATSFTLAIYYAFFRCSDISACQLLCVSLYDFLFLTTFTLVAVYFTRVRFVFASKKYSIRVYKTDKNRIEFELSKQSRIEYESNISFRFVCRTEPNIRFEKSSKIECSHRPGDFVPLMRRCERNGRNETKIMCPVSFVVCPVQIGHCFFLSCLLLLSCTHI